ncbi:MAG TPA: hypothetical protein VKW04_24595, partial [Planctomycetota bacterium]|nr:hypothetical protein [Planctomycetota bacterium]
LYSLWFHHVPGWKALIHIGLATGSLSVPAVVFLVALDPLLRERRSLKDLLLLSLPCYVAIEGLAGWRFWHFHAEPESHYVVGWLDGALYGLFHGLGLVGLQLLDRKDVLGSPTDSPSPASRSPRAYGVLVLGLLLSLLSLGVGLSKFIEVPPRPLHFAAADRGALLTMDDLNGVFKRPEAEARGEHVSKVFLPAKGYELKYEYEDAARSLVVTSFSIVAPSANDAQSTFWALGSSLDVVRTRFPRFSELLIQKDDLVTWGKERSGFLIKEGTSIRGGAVAAYDGNKVTFMLFISPEPLESSEAVGSIFTSALQRLDHYIP